MEHFDTVSEAIRSLRKRIWGQEDARDCTYKSRTDGACVTYTVRIGKSQVWHLSCDNYGRFTQMKAEKK